jgi:D-glycero-beta-D-manno-heptose-7-phosphate kinase
MHQLKRKKVMVVGDLMLDVYTMGLVDRISPEAPVPVLRVTQENRKAGGAGNAILNLVTLGMEVIPLGRLGNDFAGRTFLETMEQENVDVRGIFIDDSFQTPLKNRIIASGQQIVRVDFENPTCLSPKMEKQIVASLSQLLEGVQVLAISDYAKGFLTPSFLSILIENAKIRAIPVIVDPKGIDFTRYRGATVIKPNLSEAVSAAGLGREATLDQIAARLISETEVESLIVTRSKEGISLFSHEGIREDYPAQVHEVKDVTGAGDTVLAILAAALANELPLSFAAELANIAAGLAIEKIGCARISLAELSARLLEIHTHTLT